MNRIVPFGITLSVGALFVSSLTPVGITFGLSLVLLCVYSIAVGLLRDGYRAKYPVES